MNMLLRERAARYLLSHLTEPCDAEMHRLVENVGAENAWLFVSQHDGQPTSNTSLTEAMKRWRPRIQREHTLEQAMHTVNTLGITGTSVVIPGDPVWPNRLADLGDDAPLALFVRGSMRTLAALNNEPSVSIVGARAATSYGEHVAGEISADLAQSGYVTVSGAAYGIDGVVHRMSLATGGKTIAFLAGGVDRPYPAGHAQLIERVAAAGCVISEVPPGSTPTKWRFLSRNRLIAAVTPGTLVVEAGWRSGSLNTAGHAVSMSRTLMAVPGPVTSAASAGCHRIIREMNGTLVTDANDVKAALSINEGASL